MTFPNDITRVSVATDGSEADGFSTFFSGISADGRYVTFASYATNLIADDTNGRTDTFVYDRQTGETTRVSIAADGAEGTNNSDMPDISADGRFVVFRSDATNLVAGDTNGDRDIFVHDRVTGETRRVSIATDGSQANGNSFDVPSISGDGRYVAFQTNATNLVAGDTNGYRDIFVRDRQTNETTRVSVATDGTEANERSDRPIMSDDGRYVTFSSNATNLVAGDTNGQEDIFVNDLQTGETTRVSVATDGSEGSLGSYNPSLSGDGRYVAFSSRASNLWAGDFNDSSDIFVHDRQTGETSRISVTTDGTASNFHSDRSDLSDDGRFVVFQSDATNLVAGDTNNYRDIFVHDRMTGTTRRVSVAADGSEGNGRSQEANISADGSAITFYSVATNLVSGDTNNQSDAFVVSNPLFSDDNDNTLVGTEGDDLFFGLAGNDTISGLAGNDTLNGGTGDDTINGGAGTDTAVFTVASGDIAVALGVGGLDISSTEGNDFVADDVENFEFSNGVFTYAQIAAQSSVNLVGTAGDDRLEGGDGDDTINGGDGQDILIGGGGNDTLIGGTSVDDLRDTIYGGDGNDTIDGGYGNDELRGDAGNDTIAGGFGADRVIGGTGDDVLTGSALGDEIFGGDGFDFVNGGWGHDRVNGGADGDRFFHIGIFDHGSDWIQDYNAAEGDVLVFGNTTATAADFQVNLAHTSDAEGERSGDDNVEEAFVIYRPTGQIMWALVDGGGQAEINLSIGGEVFDLLG